MAGYTIHRRALVGTTILASHVGVARHNFAAMMAIRRFCGHKSFEILQSCRISKAESGHIVCREPFSKNDDKSILA
mgnify:CR=1 FL=1